jgi:hypothetical protein
MPSLFEHWQRAKHVKTSYTSHCATQRNSQSPSISTAGLVSTAWMDMHAAKPLCMPEIPGHSHMLFNLVPTATTISNISAVGTEMFPHHHANCRFSCFIDRLSLMRHAAGCCHPSSAAQQPGGGARRPAHETETLPAQQRPQPRQHRVPDGRLPGLRGREATGDMVPVRPDAEAPAARLLLRVQDISGKNGMRGRQGCDMESCPVLQMSMFCS